MGTVMPHKWFLLLVAIGLASWTATWADDSRSNRSGTFAVCLAEDASGSSQEATPGTLNQSSSEFDETALTDEQRALRDKIRSCLAYYFYRPENTQRRSPWAVMHVIVGFGVDASMLAGDQDVNAIAWLCANGPCYGMQLLQPAPGSVGVRMGPGYQGHHGQWLAILAQSRVKIDYPLVVQGQRLSIADLVRAEQATCRAGTELTFKLIGLAHYLEPDATWQSDDGQTWKHLAADPGKSWPSRSSAPRAEGTHRLMGFSYAVRKVEKRGQPLAGQWLRAKEYLDKFHAYTFKLQNADGSFSTNWFASRGDHQDLDRRLNTTGHTLEWLVYSLPQESAGRQASGAGGRIPG
jgi:hypothetical protein